MINSSQLLRAAVFTGDDSQRGAPSTAMYTQLDTSSANRLDTFSSNLPLVVFDDNGLTVFDPNGLSPLPDNDTYYPGLGRRFQPGREWDGLVHPDAGLLQPGYDEAARIQLRHVAETEL